MAKPRPQATILYSNPASLAHVELAFQSLDDLINGTSGPEEARQALESDLDLLVDELSMRCRRHHPFDVVEAVRREQMPTTLEGFREVEAPGLAACIEVVALLVSFDERTDWLPIWQEDAERLGQLARDVVDRIQLLRRMWELTAEPHPLLGLSYELAAQELLVRNIQYEHIRREHLTRLFSPMATELKESIGCSWEELDAVVAGATSYLEERLNIVPQQLHERERAALHSSGSGRVGLLIARAAYQAFMSSPRLWLTINAQALSDRLKLDRNLVESVLRHLSYPVGDLEPKAAITQLATGRNPLEGKFFAADGNENYCLIHPAQFLDHARQRLERELRADPKAWDRYQAHRAHEAEALATDLVENLLDASVARTNVLYRMPPGKAPSDVPIAVAKTWPVAEADAVFLCENVAILVEVKAGGITPRARAGDARRLAGDLESVLGEASKQARRTRDLIMTHHGLWLESGEWWDLGQVDMVHSIVVSLDDLSVAGIAMDTLARAGLVPVGDYPWFVSLHDLSVIGSVLERPAEFLLYLRRRTSPSVAKLFHTTDELDLLMVFLRGQLYALPDPDLLDAQDPAGARTSAAYRRAYGNQVPIFVQSHTDELDAWVWFDKGVTATPADRPRLQANPFALHLVDKLADRKRPGWFGFGADLLDTDEAAQRKVEQGYRQIAAASARDGLGHSFTMTVNGQWGYVLLVLGTRGAAESKDEAVERLRIYMEAKRYQTKAARSLLVLFGPSADGLVLEDSLFLHGAWAYDPNMEARVVAADLIPLRDPRPPYGRRATRQLRGTSKRKGSAR